MRPLHFLPPPCIFITLCLLYTVAHAFPPKWGSGPPPSSVRIVQRGIVPAKNSHNFNQSIGPVVNGVEASVESLGPDWPVLCSTPGRIFALPPVIADCQRISTAIATSGDATVFRVYKAAEGGSHWSHGGCAVTLVGAHAGATDVFQPVLIARDIMRVARFCAMQGAGGVTGVGPRMKFILFVVNYGLEVNGTVTAE